MNRIRLQLALLCFILLSFAAISSESSIDKSLIHARNTWDEFVSALRTGDMPKAYAKMSKSSKRSTSYRDFCVEWHPIGIKYNAVLSNPNYSDFSIYGNIAAVKIGLDTNLNTNKSQFLRILLEKDADKWFIVDEKRQAEAISRASICGVMRDIVRESKVLNTAFITGIGNFNDIKKELPRIFSSDRGRLALTNFTFELDLLRDGVLRATPKQPGLLGYEITEEGTLSEFHPSNKQNITAEELQAIREKTKKAEDTVKDRRIQEYLAKAKKSSERVKTPTKRSKKPRQTVSKTPASNLPEMPPEFPMDFNKLTTHNQTTQNKKKLRYRNSKEDFDLPEIDSIAPSLFSKPKVKKAELQNIKQAENRTMAGGNDEVHSNTVNINSEVLLEELEMMIEEYDQTAPLSIVEGDNE